MRNLLDCSSDAFPSSIYTFFAAFVVVLWPVWEARGILAAVSRGIVNDVLGRGLLKV